MLKQKLVLGVIGLLLLVACGGGTKDTQVKSVLGDQRVTTEAASVGQQTGDDVALQNTRGFNTGVYALIDTTLYRFGADGSLQSSTENVHNAWYVDGQMIEQRADGLYVVPLDDEARKVIDLQPTDTIATLSLSPSREYALVGFETERTLLIPYGFVVATGAVPFQRYVIVNLDNGAVLDVVYEGDDVVGFALFQGVPLWTTDNQLLVVARLIPSDVEFDAMENFPFRRLIHEVFLVDPAAATTDWREDINISSGTFDFVSLELNESSLINSGNNVFGLSLASLQPDLNYGRAIVQYRDDILYASIEVAVVDDEITTCTQRAIRRESLSRESGYVFLPMVLFQGPAAAFSDLWWYDDHLWFLRSYAADCSSGQVDLALMTADVDENNQTVFAVSDTHIDPYNLILAPAPDNRAVLWNSGDANNVFLMATYPDSRTTEVIFRRQRSANGRGLIAAGWLTPVP